MLLLVLCGVGGRGGCPGAIYEWGGEGVPARGGLHGGKHIFSVLQLLVQVLCFCVVDVVVVCNTTSTQSTMFKRGRGMLSRGRSAA